MLQVIQLLIDCYVKNSHLNRVELMRIVTDIPVMVTEEMLMDINPGKICEKVLGFINETDLQTKKHFYLGVTTDEIRRFGEQTRKYNPDVIKVIAPALHHDQ